MREPWSFGESELPVVSTAIHAGHDLRPALAARTGLDDATRRYEEDPFTDRLTAAGGAPVIVHCSRFEVDMNRPRDGAVYVDPEAAWGLPVWREPLPAEEIDASLALYDEFHAALADRLDALARRGPFVVLDLHSYNHRRDGANAPAADPAENPEVNVGTGSLDRDRWGALVDRFMGDLAAQQVKGRPLDVRENVRFKGGDLSRWVHQRYPDVGCALALEFKKVFMDEWTAEPDDEHLDQLTGAMRASIDRLVDELAVAFR